MSRKHSRPRRSTAARVGSGLVTLLSILATLAGVAYLAPSLFGYERYVITGGSMSGTFEKGAIAFEEPVPVDELKVGDVITYLPPADSGVTTLVTHRIIKDTTLKTGVRQLQTQGDANPDPDPWKFSLTEGEQPVVRHTVPHLGWVFVALADREIRMVVIGIPAALIALAALVELARAIGGRREDGPRAVTGPVREPAHSA
ncbi:signal peptidase I [Aeromicrobium sp. SMF47]|uniref:Signal peptidase I n=1 Tax=Aeromicrobium yanjiei TaxID=2662028 RepID=A0A5Q2MJ50_9ACTN|nr:MULTISPECIES: signal peptidase I [Aeromicrobium]MRJ75204.1 signal peptidase I [Aeromicrobium yanjiei]MRK02738.1 signal peptidase I [Aeromicrobium sp. S22]QGG40345.1 signal peptidase I [Aeromicrobium yanjiei]